MSEKLKEQEDKLRKSREDLKCKDGIEIVLTFIFFQTVSLCSSGYIAVDQASFGTQIHLHLLQLNAWAATCGY